jgi:hypothetical protein
MVMRFPVRVLAIAVIAAAAFAAQPCNAADFWKTVQARCDATAK